MSAVFSFFVKFFHEISRELNFEINSFIWWCVFSTRAAIWISSYLFRLSRVFCAYAAYLLIYQRLAAIFSSKDKNDKKYPDFKLKEWFSGVIWENPPLSPRLSPCWGRKAGCKWKNLVLNPGTEPSTTSVGTASPKDSSYLFFSFLCLAHRRQRKDSFKTGKGGRLFKRGN